MAAPIGNKFAANNPNSGRSKKWTTEEIEKQAENLLKWARTEEALVIHEFAPLNGYSRQRFDEWCDISEVFSDAYEQAKTLIGSRREKLHLDKLVNRYADFYDNPLLKHEQAKLQFESELKKQEIAKVGEDTINKFDAIMSMLSANQQSSLRKIADNNNNKDAQS